MGWMLKNSDGKPDAVLTMAAIAFATVVFKVLLEGVTFTVHGTTVGLGSVDASVIGSLLTPTLGAYVARRYTDKKVAADAAQPDPTSQDVRET